MRAPHAVMRSSVGSVRSAMLQECWGLRRYLSIAILDAFRQPLSRKGKLLPRLTESYSKYILKCANS